MGSAAWAKPLNIYYGNVCFVLVAQIGVPGAPRNYLNLAIGSIGPAGPIGSIGSLGPLGLIGPIGPMYHLGPVLSLTNI